MDNYTDQQLIQLAAQGREEALAILIKRYLKLVYSLSYRYLLNRQDAEDVTQDIFVKVW